jgi:hypothetical protein
MYETLMLYDANGNFLGYTLREEDAKTLHTKNFWPESEVGDFREQINRLNDAQIIRQFWPDLLDPDVQNLINDPTWEPLELHEDTFIDMQASDLKYTKDGNDLDRKASNIVWTTRMVPETTDVQRRTRKAQETIARRRSGLKV